MRLFLLLFLMVMLLMTLTVYKSDRFSLEDARLFADFFTSVRGGFSGILFVRSISFGMAILSLLSFRTDSFAYLQRDVSLENTS